ncbi:MAG: acetyltransferase [Candidatus Methylacidiphilales bacterium]
MKPTSKSTPVLILGTDDHAQVIIDLCQILHRPIAGLVALQKSENASEILGVPVFADDRALKQFHPDQVELASGIASVRVSEKREILFQRYKKEGYRFAQLIHPAACIAQNVHLGEGCVLMAGSIVQTGVQVGDNVILNTGCSIDHHCQIGDHVHVAPGAILAGRVRVGISSFIGAGATIIQGVEVGRGCAVAAGAVVVGPVFDGSRVMGIPASEH